ncbi:MAG TPA: hypothetical protein VGR34_04735 [Candidatus Dormibacteraeota bacterium]|nr:hypothetical protein [Candidatus Dormibacteraeota bacterium]
MKRIVMALLVGVILTSGCGSAPPIQSQDGVVVAPDQAQLGQAPANGQSQAGPGGTETRPAPAVPAPRGGACTGGGRPAHLCPPP